MFKREKDLLNKHLMNADGTMKEYDLYTSDTPIKIFNLQIEDMKCSDEFLTKFIEFAKSDIYETTEFVFDFFLKVDNVTSKNIDYVLSVLHLWRIVSDSKPIMSIHNDLLSIYNKIIKIGYIFKEEHIAYYITRCEERPNDDIFTVLFSNCKQPINIAKLIEGTIVEEWFGPFMKTDPQKLLVISPKLGNEILENVVFCPEFDTIFPWLTERKFVPNNRTLQIAISKSAKNLLQQLFRDYKFKVKDYYHLFVESIEEQLYSELLTETLDVLIDNGFVKITMYRILELTVFRCHINNVERFITNDKDKQQFIECCYKRNMYKNYKVLGISEQTSKFYEHCLWRKSVPSMTEMVKNGYKPDLRALNIACTIPDNLEVITYLLKYVKPDNECIEKICKPYDKTGTLWKMIQLAMNHT